MGFNLSHSLGIVAIAAFILTEALTDFAAALGRPSFLVAALVIPAVYLFLSLRYWFIKPTIGILVGGGLLLVGVVGGLVA